MLCWNGKLSLLCFIVSSVTSAIPNIIFRLEFDNYFWYFRSIWITHMFLYGFLNVLIFLTLRDFTYQIAVRATLLGYAFGIGILAFLTAPTAWQMFGLYISVLAIFHYSEFLSIAWTNPKTLSIDSFILNHSIAYGVAACLSWLEFLIETWLFPEIKEYSFISYFGFVLCFAGEIFRKLAMFTAKHNFNHMVQSVRAEDHQLITHGVYRLCRHPSYVGWFYWSIGTQLILQNPLCAMAYVITSWRFFHDRILIEEITLLNFFGDAYVEYQKQVGTGLPFISGYKAEL